ncbi:MAG: hypothetical protein M0Z34_01770 [Nitrospiraceae bacterium]|nr:hypothetical protein [Nitrospiraceae bacterium]
MLVTHLTAIEEAAAKDVLCSEKTGTITQNLLSVTAVRDYDGLSDSDVVALGVAASDSATQDPIDLAIIAAAAEAKGPGQRVGIMPVDPRTKQSEAIYAAGAGPFGWPGAPLP